MKALLWLLCRVVITSSLVEAWECNSTVSPTSYVTFPRIYGGVLVLQPDGINCNSFQTLFQCHYTKVLGDGIDASSSTPNLNSNAYLKRFLAWDRGSTAPFLDFDLTGFTASLTAIQITFLNSPSNRISLPDMQLFSVVYGSSSLTDSLTALPSLLLDNQDLTANDHQIRTITITPVQSVAPSHIRISFIFTELHSFDWLLVSEVMFCDSPQSLQETSVTFVHPQSLIVQPSGMELMSGTTQLTCTLSSQGRFSWHWELDNATLRVNDDESHSVSVGDGTRTTVLTLSDLNFASVGAYSCVAMATDSASTQIVGTLTQEINFPEYVESAPAVGGVGEVKLVCEVHGYLTAPSPPLWVDPGGSPLTEESTRVTLETNEGNKSIVLENGTTLPSIIVVVSIRNLTLMDEGNYTCKGDRGESVTIVTVVTPPPPTTPTSSTPPPTTQPQTTIENVSITRLATSEATTTTTSTTHIITPSNSTTLPVPVIAVMSVVGGLTLLCVLIVLPPLVVYAIQRGRYKQEKRELEQTTHREPVDTPDVSNQPKATDAVVVENPVFKFHNQTERSRFEQSEIFSYYRDL